MADKDIVEETLNYFKCFNDVMTRKQGRFILNKLIISTKESYKWKVLGMIKKLKNKIMPNQKIINWSQFQIIDLIEEELTKRIKEMK